jgi:dTDP-4-dehydrorhamnose 3,5-epimerase-like enzyme
MRNIKKINLKSFYSSSGKLTPITFNKNFPFKIKRIFFLHGKINKVRGDHAHKKCTQLFMPISGKMVLEISTPNLTKKISINANSKFAILVPPKYWCSIKFLKKNSILMVMNDREYEFNDYIETFNEYKKYLNKK